MKLTKYLIAAELDREKVLLINSLSGAIDLVERPLWDSLLLKISEPDTTEHELIPSLRSRGYIFDNADQEEQTMADLAMKIEEVGRRHQPISAVICPTYTCNFRCQYCYEDLGRRASQNFMKVKDVDLIFAGIDQLVEMRSPVGVDVELFGGEPLLPRAKHVVAKTIKKCEERNYPLSIITNGSTVSYHTELLSKHKHTVTNVQITLDGLKEMHDRRRPYANGKSSFEDVVKSVDWLISAGINVAVRVNLDAENLEELPAFTDFIFSKGWPESRYFTAGLSPVTDHTGTGLKHMLTEDVVVSRILEMQQQDPRLKNTYLLSMFRVLNHLSQVLGFRGGSESFPMFQYCEANSLQFFVFGVDGLVYACPESIGNPEYAIGEFRPSLVLDEDRLSQWDDRHALKIEKCRDCSIATFCGGGCAFAALKTNGSIGEPVCNQAHDVLLTYINSHRDRILESFEGVERVNVGNNPAKHTHSEIS